MDIESKLFDLYKDKAISVINSQLAFIAAYILALFGASIGGIEKEYFIKLVAMAIFVGISYYSYCDLKYREYRRNYINILVLSSLSKISEDKKIQELISMISNESYISEKNIGVSIDDLVSRGILKIETTVRHRK